MKVNNQDLQKFNGIWKGQSCFVVGGGYSLSDFDFDLLQGQNVIAVNRSFEKCHFADFFITIDTRFLTWLANGSLGWEALQIFEQFKGEKFYVNTAHREPPIEVTEITELQSLHPNVTVGYPEGLEKGLYTLGNSGGAGLQLAVVLGANPIYLLGFDGEQRKDKTHHHKEYPIPTKIDSLRHYSCNFEKFSKLVPDDLKIININDPDKCGIQCFEFCQIETEKNPYVVVSFFTEDEMYTRYAETLVESIEKHGLEYDIECVKGEAMNIEEWKNKTHYKPSFILKMLKKHKDKNVVWIDADAIIRKYPKLFDTLTCDLGVHYLNGTELLSGTMFFKNSPKIRRIVKKWVDLCGKENKLQKSEQINLQRTLSESKNIDVYDLPYSYTKIFDKMSVCPVIEHMQASRTFRRRVQRT